MASSLLIKRGIRGLVAIMPCLVAAACTHADGAGSSLEQTIAVSSPPVAGRGAVALAPSHVGIIASLPDAAGHVVTVRVHQYVNGLRQDVVLDGDDIKGVRNGLTVLARTSRQSTLDEAVPLRKPTETDIRSEIGAEFPHLAMQVVERESSNAYGPYGLALGRVGADTRCLFMWQWIDDNRLPPDADVDGPVSVRVHLCQARTSFDAMAALVDHMTIGGATMVDAGMIESDHPVHHRKMARRAFTSGVAQQTRDRRETGPTPDLAMASAPSPISADAKAPLSTDLPPEAYLGPKASVRSY